MTNLIILTLCLLVLLSYLFDVTARYSKIPGVILLILLGIVIQIITGGLNIRIPNLRPVLPVIGTVGLIMIVLEASLDLKLGRNRTGLIVRSASAAIILFVLFVAAMTIIMTKLLHLPVIESMLNAIPFGIISSAVAISSSVNLSREQREFVVYESSLSDIIGILAFDFIVIYGNSIGHGLMSFALNGVLTILVAVVVTSALALLMYKINYHINYIIILTAVILVYVLGKLIHLPALLLVLAFGIALANNSLVEKTRVRKYIDFEKFRTDLDSFKKIMAELTFLVRSFFFIMFGYYTKIEGLFNLRNLIAAFSIIAGIYLLRVLFLWKVLKISVFPYLFFSPRGLITILLFLSIPAASRISLINEEVVTLVILISILLMMLGNIIYRTGNSVKEEIQRGSEGELLDHKEAADKNEISQYEKSEIIS